MKKYFIGLILLILCGCTQIRKLAISYNFVNYSTIDKLAVTKLSEGYFISYKDVLFEFLIKKNIYDTIKNYNETQVRTSVEGKIDTIGVYVIMPIKEYCIRLDSFTKDASIVDLKYFDKKQEGVSLKGLRPNDSTIKNYDLSRVKLKDTFFRNTQFKYYDTIMYSKEMNRYYTSRTFFSKKYDFNSLYNLYIPTSKMLGFNILGFEMSILGNKEKTLYICEEFKILGTKERNICESVYQKVIKYVESKK
jgi:hypothetical protein